jgi:Fic family protein
MAQIAELDEFKGHWTGVEGLDQEQLTSLKRVSTIESIGSSARIEGNRLSDGEVEELLSHIDITSFNSRDEAEVAGYARLMDTIFDHYEIIPLSENYIKQLHSILLQFVSKDEWHLGEYKKLPNSVAAFGPDGKEIGVVFETATPFDTPRFMEDLIEWTRKNLDDPYLHPLIVIGVFIAHFLAIHPFQDGNGRLSRALTTMLLLKKGYAYTPYSSLEAVIERSKEGYYRALHRTQKNIFTGKKVDYEPWLSFFFSSLLKQKRHLEEKIKVILTESAPKSGAAAGGPSSTTLSRTQRAILDLFEKEPRLDSPRISVMLGANIETVKKALRGLVAQGCLVKNGVTKGAWYERR